MKPFRFAWPAQTCRHGVHGPACVACRREATEDWLCGRDGLPVLARPVHHGAHP